MTKLEMLFANLAQLEDRFSAAALAYRLADSAARKSRSKANLAAYVAASDEFDNALEAVRRAQAAVYCEEKAEEYAERASEALAERSLSPDFDFDRAQA